MSEQQQQRTPQDLGADIQKELEDRDSIIADLKDRLRCWESSFPGYTSIKVNPFGKSFYRIDRTIEGADAGLPFVSSRYVTIVELRNAVIAMHPSGIVGDSKTVKAFLFEMLDNLEKQG